MPDAPPFVPLTAEQITQNQQLVSVFMPYASQKRNNWVTSNGLFAHYTSAESGLKIINSSTLWMRSPTAMADYREVNHGFDLINTSPEIATLIKFLNENLDGLGAQATAGFMEWWEKQRMNVYVSSISEHDPSENEHGRLSMWRAFGNGSGARIALILKLPLQPGEGQALRILMSPVSYFTKTELSNEVQTVQNTIASNLEFLRSVPREALLATAFYMFLMAVLCMKHEGFKEEREWRIAHLPLLLPSPFMKSSIQVIGGIPQRVFHIPLSQGATPDLANFGLHNMIDRVIIGPTQYPWIMYEAFVEALKDAGVPEAHRKVITSQIPLRNT